MPLKGFRNRRATAGSGGGGGEGLSLDEYLALSSELPAEAKAAVEAAWGNARTRPFAPPSGLPDISPSRGEIAQRGSQGWSQEKRAPARSPPLRGRCRQPEGGDVERSRSWTSPSAPRPSAMSPSRSPPIAAALPTAAPTITIRRCRRATNSSPSACGCARRSASMRSSMSARMARWNGCPARRWR